VCAHELTHLKRGDHRALWVEEALLAVLAINPVLRPIRDRRAAAREEACDAQVLARADGDARRLYARALLDALRAPARPHVPALTFTSTRRIFVMHRLKAVLSPAPAAGRRSRLAVLGLGVAVAAVAATGSVALAARREPIVTPRPAVAPVAASSPVVTAEPAARPDPSVAPTPAAAASDVREAAPEPVAAPQTRTITNPSWTQAPMPSYPAAALEQGSFGGQVDLSCTVEANGGVSGCTILAEDPVGAGYGSAALQAAAAARLSPRSVEGAAVGGTVRFSIRFTRAPE
jgi:TonB family protein